MGSADGGRVQHHQLICSQEIEAVDVHDTGGSISHVYGHTFAVDADPSAGAHIGRSKNHLLPVRVAECVDVRDIAHGGRRDHRNRVQHRWRHRRQGGWITVSATKPGPLSNDETVFQRICRRSDVGQRAVSAQQNASPIVRVAKYIGVGRTTGISFWRKGGGWVGCGGVNVKIPDPLPMRLGFNPGRNDLIRTQLNAEAVADVLASGGAALRPILREDYRGAELGTEVYIGAPDQLDVDDRGKRGLLEIRAQIIDSETAGRIRNAGAQGVILYPVRVKGADRRAGDGNRCFARGQPAVDRPGPEPQSNRAPVAVGNAVFPHRGEPGLLVAAPQRLDRGNGELQRRRRARPRLQVRDGTAVYVDLKRLSAISGLITERECKRAIATGLSFCNQGRSLGPHLIIGQNRKRVLGAGNRERGHVLLFAMPIEPNRDLGERLRALGTNQSTQVPSKRISHSKPLSDQIDAITGVAGLRDSPPSADATGGGVPGSTWLRTLALASPRPS